MTAFRYKTEIILLESHASEFFLVLPCYFSPPYVWVLYCRGAAQPLCLLKAAGGDSHLYRKSSVVQFLLFARAAQWGQGCNLRHFSKKEKYEDPSVVYGRDPRFSWLDVLTAVIDYN